MIGHKQCALNMNLDVLKPPTPLMVSTVRIPNASIRLRCGTFANLHFSAHCLRICKYLDNFGTDDAKLGTLRIERRIFSWRTFAACLSITGSCQAPNKGRVPLQNVSRIQRIHGLGLCRFGRALRVFGIWTD